MRGMWTQFDHFSDLDPSFRCPISETIPDLIASQEMEWADRNLLKAQKLQEMKSSRNRYEEEKRKKELEELEAAKGKNLLAEHHQTNFYYIISTCTYYVHFFLI